MSSAVAVVASLLASVPLWSGIGSDVVVEGGRAPVEAAAVVTALVPELTRCAQGAGFDVVVEVKVSGPGSVLGTAAVILSPEASSRLSLTCVAGVFEGATFKDRGLEPPSYLLLRFTDDGDPADLPIGALRKAVQWRQGRIARCVRRLRLQNPTLRGAVVARLELDIRGDAVVHAEGMNPLLRACVRDGLVGLSVDGFPGPRTVVAPFHFDAPPAEVRVADPAAHPTLASWLGCDLWFP